MSDLVRYQQELAQIEQTVLTAISATRAVSRAHLELTSRVGTLEEQMLKRIYVSPAHKNMLQKAVNNHVRALVEQYGLTYKDCSKKVFPAVWRALKDKYSISVYSELPDIEFDNALEFIRKWEDEVLLNRLKSEMAA